MSTGTAGQASSSGTLNELFNRPWKEVASVCKDAAVFVDENAAELLHWAGGIELLGECVGVYDLYKDLSPVARDFIATAPYSCVVIVVTSFLHGTCSKRIAHFMSDLQPLECHVFSSKSEQLHSEWIPMPGGGVRGVEGGGWESGNSKDVYSHYGEFQALLRKWMSRESGVRVSVSHLPLFSSEVCPGLLITPTCSTLFPLLPSDLDDVIARCIDEGDVNCSLEHLGQVDFDMLTHPFRIEIKSLVRSLNGLMEGLDLKEELFSLGYTSRFICSQLAALPEAKSRRKTASQRCSVLLVDRTLDLCGPTSHQTDCLADRILGVLNHLTQSSSDVCVDMSPIAPPYGGTSDVEVGGCVVNGCLAQPGDRRARQLLQTLICSKQKESLMETSRCLLDSVSQEKLSVKLTGKLGRPSAQQLQAFLEQFRSHPGACVSHKSILQLACAVVEALDGPPSKHWDELASIEKVLMLGASDVDSPSILSHLTDLAKKQIHFIQPTPLQQVPTDKTKQQEAGSQTPLTLSELFGLAVCMYSLVGEECMEKQTEMSDFKEAVADLILKWRECDSKFVTSVLQIGKSDSRARVLGKLGSMFQTLEAIGDTRNELKQFRHTHKSGGPLPYASLLSQLVNALFDSTHPDLSDMNFHSQGSMANIIKSGFSLFMSSARPHPTQHPTLLLFVVGGITCTEVRQIREIVSTHKSDIKVIIGATKLVTQNDITRMVFSNDRIRS